ncbi:MAG TPA: hypothetical protein VFS39_13715 [Nitrospira sp.]|nr:hypothetical protein [Nitrospira sp.]
MPADTGAESNLYRVTLFFGPEQTEKDTGTSTCVFNVKKRSWKGGIQVAVDMTDRQIEACRAVTDFDQWLTKALAELPMEDRSSMTARAGELFVQALCRCKLERLLQEGLSQENQRIASGSLTGEVFEFVREHVESIKSYVADELDIAPSGPACS